MAGVDRGLVAKNMGTSLLQLEKTYGHIDTEISAAELIKGQGYQSRALDLLDTEVEWPNETDSGSLHEYRNLGASDLFAVIAAKDNCNSSNPKSDRVA